MPIAEAISSGDNRIAGILEHLKEGVQDVFQSDSYRRYLETVSRFHQYSINNCLLIAMQNPDASLVAGYTTWQRQFDRQVKKGEKGIKILCPAPIREKKSEKEYNENGEEIVQEREIITTHFKIGTVFDVSQTEGSPLPTIAPSELVGSVAMFEDIKQIVAEIAPVPVRYDGIASGAKGYYSNTNKEIVIRSGMSEVQTLKTLIHETAHAVLHDHDTVKQNNEKKSRGQMETEAESVAFTVCSTLGLDTGDYSFPYLATWSGGQELKVLQESLQTIRNTSHEIIAIIESRLQAIDRYEIWQITADGPMADCMFLPYEEVAGRLGAVEGYERAYMGKFNGETLEELYTRFNLDQPDGYSGHSLSVSDLVILSHGGEKSIFYVDNFGFREIDHYNHPRKEDSINEEQTQKESVNQFQNRSRCRQ